MSLPNLPVVCVYTQFTSLMFDRRVVHIVVAGYIVDNYYLRLDRGVVHIVVDVILLPITV